MAQPSQLYNNQFIPGSQLQSNLQAPVTSTIHGPMCINQQLNPVGQNQFSQPLINQSLLPTVNQHISSVHSNTNVTQERGNNDFKHSIKLPPLKLQNFNVNPIHFHEWINNFNTMIHNNTSITDTHRITYLQNSVSGKAKDLIHAYSCDPSYFQAALSELIRHFGDHTVVVNAFINQLENWQMNFQNKQSFIAFSSFLKRLVQAFQYLGFTADLQSTTLIKKEKTPHHLVLKWTEHCLTELRSDPTLVDIQQWLELQAQIYGKVSRESNQRTISFQASKFVNSNNLQTMPYKATSHCQSTTHQRKTVENIGTLRLSRNNRQLHKTFRIKLLTQNDLARSANKNTALPLALSISCAHQVIDTTSSAKAICVQTA